MIVVSVFTPFAVFLSAAPGSALELWGAMSLPVAAIMYAWPGALVFLVLGWPTLYVLFRTNHTSFLTFAFFGALYTALPWALFQVLAQSRRGLFLNFNVLFIAIGLVNGTLTRLILVGFRKLDVET